MCIRDRDAAAATETVVAETQIAGDSMHHVMMQKFLEGGWEWMLPVLLCLVIGLAVAIERILYLSLSTINSKKLIASVEEALKNGGIEAAKEVCRNTRGPIASIYYQGLDRYDQGLDAVEKAVVSYGSVQTGQMESGLSWIGLFIALSPMLGFMEMCIRDRGQTGHGGRELREQGRREHQHRIEAYSDLHIRSGACAGRKPVSYTHLPQCCSIPRRTR